MFTCDNCHAHIKPGQNYVAVVRQVERIGRLFRRSIIVEDSNLVVRWCLDCAAKSLTVEVRSTLGAG